MGVTAKQAVYNPKMFAGQQLSSAGKDCEIWHKPLRLYTPGAEKQGKTPAKCEGWGRFGRTASCGLRKSILDRTGKTVGGRVRVGQANGISFLTRLTAPHKVFPL